MPKFPEVSRGHATLIGQLVGVVVGAGVLAMPGSREGETADEVVEFLEKKSEESKSLKARAKTALQ